MGVPAPVPLESTARCVKGVAVDLDHELALAPDKVDLVTMQSLIDLRRREPRGADELEQPPLGLGARHRRRVGRSDHSPERIGAAMPGIAGEEGIEPAAVEELQNLGLLDGADEVPAPEAGRQVEERAAGAGDRDPTEPGNIGRREPASLMHADAVARARLASRECHRHRPLHCGSELPQLRGRAVAQQGMVAHGECCRAESRQRPVDRADEVDAAVDWAKPAARDEPRDLRPADAGRKELPRGQRAVLTRSELP